MTTPSKADFHHAINARSDRWYAACLRITKDPDLAADAVQDALLSAWNKRTQYQGNSRLETWIHRIAVNSALQLLRRSKSDSEESFEHEIPSDTALPDAERAWDELGAGLNQAMENLSEIERVAFVLKHLEQWRLKEIAAELNTNIGTIKQALFRGVRKLRPRMALLKESS